MATLTVQQSLLAGMTPVFVAASAGGDAFANNGKTVVEIKNTDTVPHTVTFITPSKIGGVDIVDPPVTIPATSGYKIISGFDPSLFNNAAGQVAMTYDAVTGVTICVYSV